MQEKEATSGLTGPLALLEAAQEVSANVPGDQEANTDNHSRQLRILRNGQQRSSQTRILSYLSTFKH
jgi:hypothetical protein